MIVMSGTHNNGYGYHCPRHSCRGKPSTDIIRVIICWCTGDGIRRFQQIRPIRRMILIFRVHIEAHYGRINSPWKSDITTERRELLDRYPLWLSSSILKKNIQSWHIHWKLLLAESMPNHTCRLNICQLGKEISMIYPVSPTPRLKIRPDVLPASHPPHTAEKRGLCFKSGRWADILSTWKQNRLLPRIWKNYEGNTSPMHLFSLCWGPLTEKSVYCCVAIIQAS